MLESLWALKILVLFFAGLGTAAYLGWCSLLVHHQTHELLICSVVKDPAKDCRDLIELRLKKLTFSRAQIFVQLQEGRHENKAFVQIKSAFFSFSLPTLEARQSLRKPLMENFQ